MKLTKDNWIKALPKYILKELWMLNLSTRKDLFDFISQVEKDAIEKTNKRCIERAKRSLETYVWDSNIGDGLAKDGGHDYLIEVMENRKLLTKKVLSDLLEDKNNGK